jgi:uncharacterized iron-regulated membrane protein
MKTFRSVLFWIHLACGLAAGVVIFIMSVTGVALTYEKQMLEWADRRASTASASGPSEFSGDLRRDQPLSPETLLARVAAGRADARPIAITLRADPQAPATVTIEGNKTLLVDPYSGRIIGEPPAALRSFFRTMTVWHRYLALEGTSRATGKAITGAANLVFLFLVISGMYLWLPRVWNWIQFKNVLWFRTGLAPKARDFNWHNVIGIWTAIPLAIIVAGAAPISYRWASDLVYRLAGDTPPAVAAAAPARPVEEPPRYYADGLDSAWSAAVSQAARWRTASTRLATTANAPIVVTVDEGYAGQPQKRSTITLDRASGTVAKVETFEQLSAGRRVRSWLRFAHTGEIYGLPGQTVAGLASLGGAFLAYTGVALALRRLAAFLKRRRAADEYERPRAA